MSEALLYDRVVAITEEYLGPAAHRFVARQVAFHFHKAPQELTVGDLPKLIEWTRLSLALITENYSLIDECIRKLSQLAKLEEIS